MEREVERFLNAMADKRGLAQNTIEAYRNDINQFMGMLVDKPGSAPKSWNEISAQQINICIEKLATSKYAPSTIARKVSSIRTFVEYLEAEGIIQSIPWHQVRLPKVEKRIPRTLSCEEVERLLQAPSQATSPKAIRDRALLELMYATGMRVTDILSLDIEDVDLEQGHISFHTRNVPLDNRVAEHLATYLGQARESLIKRAGESGLFLNLRGQKLTRQGLWLIIKAYAQQIQLDGDVTPHALRHSFAMHHLDEGADLRELQHLLGHANITTTQIYQQLDATRQH